MFLEVLQPFTMLQQGVKSTSIKGTTKMTYVVRLELSSRKRSYVARRGTTYEGTTSTFVLSKVLPYMCRGFYPLLVVEIFKLSNAFRARVRNRVTGPADRTLPMILDFADENHISPS
jgi:hypothetical protein